MLYQILLAVGGLGLLTQAALGFADGDGDGSHHAHVHDRSGEHGGHTWFLMLSPLRLFGVSLGVGAAGMGLQSATALPPWLVLVLALLAGWGFYRLIVKPLMALAMRFASKPATTLSGAVGQEARADSRFDATGKGIVILTVDGHLIRLLATLEGAPEPVEAGEKLLVVALDVRKNRCTVTKL